MAGLLELLEQGAGRASRWRDHAASQIDDWLEDFRRWAEDVPRDVRITDVPGEYVLPDGSIYRSGANRSAPMRALDTMTREGLESNRRLLEGRHPATGAPVESAYDRADAIANWFTSNSATGRIGGAAKGGATLGAGPNVSNPLSLQDALDYLRRVRDAGMSPPAMPTVFTAGEMSPQVLQRIEQVVPPQVARDFSAVPRDVQFDTNLIDSVLKIRREHAERLVERLPELIDRPQFVFPNYNPATAHRPLLLSATPNRLNDFDVAVVEATIKDGRLFLPTLMTSPMRTVRKAVPPGTKFP